MYAGEAIKKANLEEFNKEQLRIFSAGASQSLFMEWIFKVRLGWVSDMFSSTDIDWLIF